MIAWLITGGLVLSAADAPSAQPAMESILGTQVAPFILKDPRGKDYSLADFADKKGVVLAFLGVDCPLARLYAPRLQELADEFANRGIAFLAIDPNRQDSVTEIAHFARSHGIHFPILKDLGNDIADRLLVERVPEVFLLDGEGRVRFRGRIDDQYGLGSSSGYARSVVKERYLADAIEAVLESRPIDRPYVEASGCKVGRVRPVNEASDVTYGNQISRILQERCVSCHRPGQIAPFALTNYEEAAGWAEMIQEVIEEQRMPPWHAAPEFAGVFANDPSMTQEEKDLIYAWVENGAPAGDLAQAPKPIEYPEGWQIPPDEIFYMDDEPYALPADGTLDYQYFIVDPGWTEDRWIKSSECLIGNRAVVHHIFVFAVPPESRLPTWKGARDKSNGISGGEGGGRLIGGAAPGTPPFAFPFKGMAYHLPAGTRLLFQMHYTPNGTATTDRTAVGFTYADPAEVRHSARMNLAINPGLRIPPHADNHRVEAIRMFDRDTLIMTLAPHMHLRGKSFYYDLEYPDGSKETILNVPRYDFNWQMIYAFKEPKFVPAGTRMRAVAHFDNSENNPANPDPTKAVRFGEQTWDEMMIGWFSESTDIDPSQIDPSQSRTARFLASGNEPKEPNSLLIKAARMCLDQGFQMVTFGRQVQRQVPQVDRICVAHRVGEELEFAAVFQPPVFDISLGRENARVPANSSRLASILESGVPRVEANLSSATEGDLHRFADRLGSSFHVPIRIGGEGYLVSFWSREANAFPPQATNILEPLARLVGQTASASAGGD